MPMWILCRSRKCGACARFDDPTVLTGITYVYRVIPISQRGVPNTAGALDRIIHVAGPTTPDFFPGTVRNLRLPGPGSRCPRRLKDATFILLGTPSQIRRSFLKRFCARLSRAGLGAGAGVPDALRGRAHHRPRYRSLLDL